MTSLMVGFNDAYKEWRNRARKYRPLSIVRTAIHCLNEPVSSKLEGLERAPWQMLLLVKWVLQDRMMSDQTGRDITQSQFDELRQKLWEFPERVNLGTRETLPGELFFRQLINSQIGFQRHYSAGLVREGALLAQISQEQPLRRLFETKIGLSVFDFLDLSFSIYAAIVDGKAQLDIGWFEPLQNAYGSIAINSFLSCVSRTYPQLQMFCRDLPNSKEKMASEFYEFPVFVRYPFLRIENTLHCWHPAVFFKGLEGLVHSIMCEEGEAYTNSFSKLFEEHVIKEAKRVKAIFYDEATDQPYDLVPT
jgi:hypothetical protein